MLSFLSFLSSVSLFSFSLQLHSSVSIPCFHPRAAKSFVSHTIRHEQVYKEPHWESLKIICGPPTAGRAPHYRPPFMKIASERAIFIYKILESFLIISLSMILATKFVRNLWKRSGFILQANESGEVWTRAASRWHLGAGKSQLFSCSVVQLNSSWNSVR